MNQYQKAQEAKNYINHLTNIKPRIGLVLGSGLGSLTEEMTDVVAIPFEKIPYFEKPTTKGHSGKVVIGKLNGVYVVIFSGRYHYFEGFPLDTITLPIRVMHSLGVETLILTNSCGAINTDFNPGDLMVINDHINLVFNNPLIGENIDEFGPRFPDGTEIYTKSLRKRAHEAAENLGFELRDGIYAWWTGPSYETPAEIRMIRMLGADAVGMSTVPEAIVARHVGLSCFAVSVISDLGVDGKIEYITHEGVIDAASLAEPQMTKMVLEMLEQL